MKIKHSLIISFFILFIVPLIFMQVVTMNYYDNKMEQILENDLSVAASTQVEAIDNFCKEREADLIMFSQYDMIHELLKLSNEKNIQEFSSKRNYFDNILKVRSEGNAYIDSITVLDTAFRIVSCSQRVEPGEVSVLSGMEEKYFDQNTRFTRIIETESPQGTKKSMAAIREVYQGDELAGYVVEEINLKFFEQVRMSANLFNNGTIYIIDDEGNLISAGAGKESRSEFVLTKNERSGFQKVWNNRDKQAKSGILRYEELGVEYMSYYSGFTYTGWILITTVSVDDVLQKNTGYRALALTLVICLPALFATVNYFLSKKLGKPMDTMVERLGKVRSLEDYSIRMEYTHKNELGIISEEINSLLEYIEEHIKKEKQKQEALKEIAEQDTLTNLYNKKAIDGIFKEELKRACAEGRSIGCLFIDIDNFKEFNTKYGHLGGDKVILFVANILRDLGYPTGRVGGDEFVICINRDCTRERLEEIAGEIIDILQCGANLHRGQPSVPVTASIGIAVSKKVKDYEQLLEQADKAMYYVKNTQKNNFYLIEC